MCVEDLFFLFLVWGFRFLIIVMMCGFVFFVLFLEGVNKLGSLGFIVVVDIM